MGKLSDDGFKAIASASDAPIARYLVRKMRPMAERGLAEVKGAVEGMVDDLFGQARRAIRGEEPTPRRRKVSVKRAEVIDAEIVDEEKE